MLNSPCNSPCGSLPGWGALQGAMRRSNGTSARAPHLSSSSAPAPQHLQVPCQHAPHTQHAQHFKSNSLKAACCQEKCVCAPSPVNAPSVSVCHPRSLCRAQGSARPHAHLHPHSMLLPCWHPRQPLPACSVFGRVSLQHDTSRQDGRSRPRAPSTFATRAGRGNGDNGDTGNGSQMCHRCACMGVSGGRYWHTCQEGGRVANSREAGKSV